ncbi:helix-turn-helix domain-containing protein [Zhongshania sp.]|jgi:DNA-binding CsgD family transcriptional regulator|uniref:helix-turn-helix domain-containing protein n=1 Tax=Zhongshania sp. TaxID=1971902 RepID=UPI002A821CDC|nr:helix-turn-helix domain-containing protein [Zhongshania sp.]
MHSADIHSNEIYGPTLRATPACGLSNKICETLLWLGEGKDSEEIGMILGVSTRAIKARIRLGMDRLDAVNRTQLVAKAFLSGVLHGSALLLLVIIFGGGGSNDIEKHRNARRVTGRRSRKEYYELFTEVYDHSTHPKSNLEYV